MQETTERKRKRYKIAKELFKDLLNPENPGEVQRELKEKIKLCEEKIEQIELKKPIQDATNAFHQIKDKITNVVKQSEKKSLKKHKEIEKVVTQILNTIQPKPEVRAKFERVEVNFSKEKKHIKINKEKPIQIKGSHINQEFLLLEELVDKREIHWTRGFVLFKRWQKEIPQKGPMEQFMVIVSRLNTKIKFRLAIRAEEKKQTWELNHNITLESSIDRAKEVCEKTKNLSNLNEIIEHLKNALDLYPMSIEANKAFLQALKNKEIIKEKVIQELISTAKYLLLNKEDDLEAAIKQILQQGERTEWQKPWKDARAYVDRMIKELEEIQFYRATAEKLWDMEIPDEEKTKVSNLMDDIAKIADGNNDIIFKRFILKPLIIDVRRRVIGIVLKKIGDESYGYIDIDSFVIRILSEEAKSIKQKSFDTEGKFKSYLIEILKRRVIASIIHEKYSIDGNKQKEIWKVKRIRNKLKERHGIYPNNNELLKELGTAWNLDRLEEILIYEKEMSGGFINAEEEWKYRKNGKAK